jgi:hypothetical protein
MESLRINDKKSQTLQCLVTTSRAAVRCPVQVETFLYATMIRSTLGANPTSSAMSTGGCFLQNKHVEA